MGSSSVERVVVTGVGAVTAFGAGIEPLWAGLVSGVQPMRAMELFDSSEHRTKIAAFAPDGALDLDGRLAARGVSRHASRSDRFALVAALEAWDMAGLGQLGSWPLAGLFFGSSTGGMFEGETSFWKMQRDDTGRSRVGRFAAQPNGTPADELGRVFGLNGAGEVHAAACAASTMALEAALDSLRLGEIDLALVGGADGLCQTTFGGFNSLRAVDPEPSQPFRAERDGLSLGEGSGMLVLETESHAKRRGAQPLAILHGAGSSCDAHHMTAPHPEGAGAASALRNAMQDAGIAPEDILFVNAHGSGTPHNDLAESKALRTVFGARVDTLPVTSTKAAVGHSLGACGALEAVVTTLCLRRNLVHPTAGVGSERDPQTPVDVVLGAPRELSATGDGVAISVNLAFGGANAAIVLGRAGQDA